MWWPASFTAWFDEEPKIKIIRYANCPVSAWKNGEGSTRQLLIEPPLASLENFDFRISMATVASDGSFSSFPGIDRQLLILEGKGLQLTFNDHRQLTLERHTPPVSFAGEDRVSSLLLDGVVTDFNIMTRRGFVQPAVEYRCLMPGDTVDSEGHLSMWFLLGPEARFECEGERRKIELARYDLICFATGESLTLRSDEPVMGIMLKKGHIDSLLKKSGDGTRS